MQIQQVPHGLSRDSLGCPVELREQTLKLIYAHSPFTLSYWALICFTEEYLTARYLTLGLVSAENVKENKTKP